MKIFWNNANILFLKQNVNISKTHTMSKWNLLDLNNHAWKRQRERYQYC
jgi:hypothetical protein